MPHEDEVFETMEMLHLAKPKHIGAILADRVGWAPGQSATVQAGRALDNLVGLGKLKKENSFYMIEACKAKPSEHAELITEELVQILKRFEARIFREYLIEEVGLRPDAICLLKTGGKGLCLVLEVVNHETEEYLESKMNVWKTWPGATEYLSRLFGYKIPHFEIIALRKGEKICEKLPLVSEWES